MMTLLTGLVLAVFAGTMVQYGDSIIRMLGGGGAQITEDDHYTIAAGSQQQLDVLANDAVRGPLAVITPPNCGTVRAGSEGTLIYETPASCSGDQQFSYCVAGDAGCDARTVTITVIGTSAATAVATAATTPATNAAPVVVATDPTVMAPVEAAPVVETQIAGIRAPMLAAPQVDEFVAPNDAAASLRALGTTTNVTSPAPGIGSDTAMAQMETGFAAPSLGDEGVSLGRSVVVAGASMAADTTGFTAEATAGVAIAGLDTQVAIAAPNALAANDRTTDIVQVLERGPEVYDIAPVLAALSVPFELGSDAFDALRGGAPASTMMLASAATLQTSTGNGQSPDMAIDVVDVLPVMAQLASDDAGVEFGAPPALDSVIAQAPTVARVTDNAAQLPPNVGTSGGSPIALVAAATTMMPTSDATPEHPRMLMRHVALNTAPGALSTTDGALAVVPNIDRTTAPQLDLQVASLPLETPQTAPQLRGDTVCDTILDTSVRPGAEVMLFVTSDCRPDQMFTVRHGGIAFSAMTGTDGTASVEFPALERSANVIVEFADGAQSFTTVLVPEIDQIMRAGLSWTGDVMYELNAYEFGAAPGSAGHIHPGAARDYRAARILGGGFLTELGTVTGADAWHSSIYSMPVSRATQDGIVAMGVRIADIGAACGTETLISTFSSANAAAFAQLKEMTLPACGTDITNREIAGIIDDLRTSVQ